MLVVLQTFFTFSEKNFLQKKLGVPLTTTILLL